MLRIFENPFSMARPRTCYNITGSGRDQLGKVDARKMKPDHARKLFEEIERKMHKFENVLSIFGVWIMQYDSYELENAGLKP